VGIFHPVFLAMNYSNCLIYEVQKKLSFPPARESTTINIIRVAIFHPVFLAINYSNCLIYEVQKNCHSREGGNPLPAI